MDRRNFVISAAVAAVLRPWEAFARHGRGSASSGGGGSTFDYYISTSGSDANAGTLGSPWAITSLCNTTQNAHNVANWNAIAGKRVGLIAGTYDVSAILAAAGNDAIGLDLPGGSSSSSTYVGSSNTSGIETPRVATIEGNGNGTFGGSNSVHNSMIGHDLNVGYVTISGLTLTGAAVWCVTFGQVAGTNTAPSGIVLQNCEITGNSAATSTSASGQNCAPVQLMSGTNALITNNYIHDNFGWTDNQHFSAVYHWGLGSGTTGTVISFNTVVNSGNLHGKEASQTGTLIENNYVDMTSMTPGGGGNLACILGFYDNGSLTPGSTQLIIRNNILISNAGGAGVSPGNLGGTWIDMTADADTQHYIAYPVQIYNNTLVASAALNGCGVLGWEQTAAQKPLTFYNNLFYDAGFNAVNQYGWFWTNADVFTLCDYNIYGTHQGSSWASFSTNGTQGGLNSSAASFTAWKTAVSADANSSTSSTNPFTNGGALSLQYLVQTGSPAYQTGKVGGSGSTACNVGAWDGTVTQIGKNF